MKMLFCADVRLGAICAENLDIRQSHKWQAVRNEKLVNLIDKAAQNNAEYVALFGQMFGQARISESVIDGLFQAVKEDADIQTLAFLHIDEYKRISYRNDIPKNLHLFCLRTQDSYTDANIALRIDKEKVELRLGLNDSLIIRETANRKYVISSLSEDCIISSFEPIGFEDAQGIDCGYGIIEWTNEELGQYISKANQKYAFRMIDLKIMPEDDQNEIIRKINNAVKSIAFDSFLRITIMGRLAFGMMLDVDALKKQLQNRIFFVDVYDNTVMDIDAEAFENDISLRSEFVRLALQDDSLSESERSRLISCGWKALNGEGGTMN